jgi:hypothetical protein
MSVSSPARRKSPSTSATASPKKRQQQQQQTPSSARKSAMDDDDSTIDFELIKNKRKTSPTTTTTAVAATTKSKKRSSSNDSPKASGDKRRRTSASRAHSGESFSEEYLEETLWNRIDAFFKTVENTSVTLIDDNNAGASVSSATTTLNGTTSNFEPLEQLRRTRYNDYVKSMTSVGMEPFEFEVWLADIGVGDQQDNSDIGQSQS